jgi:ElaB/YqjD/DUF883 family membrane-anchored ribosome-binding protein
MDSKLNDLFDQTEKLLDKLADQSGPEIQRLREKLHRSIGQTRGALNSAPARSASAREHVKVRDVAASFNDYVQNYPWIALATGVLVASSIGILATRATKRSFHHQQPDGQRRAA